MKSFPLKGSSLLSTLSLSLGLNLFSGVLPMNSVAAEAASSNASCESCNFQDGYAVVNEDRVRLHYVVGGKGPALLLIPGWPQTAYTWHKIMPELARHFTVIAVDPRGLGDSNRPLSGYDTDNVARDLHELMQSLGHSAYSVVGHDVGMWIGYSMAANYPDEISRIVLSEAGIPGLDPLRSWHFAFNQLVDLPEALIEGKERIYLEWLFNSFAYRPTDLATEEYIGAYSKPGAMRAGFAYYRAIPQTIEQNKKHGLTPLKMPVLTVGGEFARAGGLKDMLAPVATNVTARVIPGAGHYPQEEAPQEMLKALLPFLTAK
jgi:pimeloyl-ACP methyl ester carboxylesterase